MNNIFPGKMLQQMWGNVLKYTTNSGETTAADGYVPENAPNPGETTVAEVKCPGKCRKTGRNYGRRGEMSRKTPLIREKPRSQR